MADRILVIGKYINRGKYILYKPGGKVFQIILEGESFKVGKFTYYPFREEKTKGEGTILVCGRLSPDNHKIIERVPLINFKKGLWALTTGAAKKGLFHWYHESENVLEKALDSMHMTKHIIKEVYEINKDIQVGGTNPKKVYFFISDSPNNQNFPKKENSKVDPYKVTINGGTFLIYYHYDIDNRYPPNPIEILLTPLADKNQVAEALKKM